LKILIVRYSSIGDVVLTTPIIRALKTQLNAEIHYLTKTPYLCILQHNPYIDKIHIIDKSNKEILETLKSLSFDYLIDLHHNLRTFDLKNKLQPIKSLSFPKLNIEKWLMVNFKINRLPKIHIVDRYFKAVEKLGVVNDKKGLDYFIPLADEMIFSRFYMDKKIPRDKARKLWADSIRNHCMGRADRLAIVYDKGEPVGMATINFGDNKIINLHIIGVLKSFQGQGIGSSLMSRITKEYGDKHEIFVETQSLNKSAQRLYKHAGFFLDSMRYILHIWP
jgi:ribosomal protein S18 acetylase RimI-like enzyme